MVLPVGWEDTAWLIRRSRDGTWTKTNKKSYFAMSSIKKQISITA